MGVIGVVKGSEGGLVNNFLLERKVGGFVGVKFIQLLYGGERQGVSVGVMSFSDVSGLGGGVSL